MNIQNLSPSLLIPYARNSKKHPKEQIEKIATQISQVGFLVPIVVDKDMVVITGHGRLDAAVALGLDSVPVLVADHLTEEQAMSWRIADNKVAESEWDLPMLAFELGTLDRLDVDLTLTGFNMDEAHSILASYAGADPRDPEPEKKESEEEEIPPVPEIAKTKRGDIYQIGEHRVMCGDSTSMHEITTLTQGQKIDVVYTDPPYGIDEKTDRDFASRTRLAKGNSFPKIIGDKSIDTAVAAFEIANELSETVCYWGGNYYAHTLPPSACWIVWDKRVEENQRDFNSDCELAYVKHPDKKSVRIFRHLWKGMIKGSEHGEGRVHPTQKPIALAEWCLNELAPEATTVLDLFGGSGSTLIACVKQKRQCFAMELSEHYCDVIIARAEKELGITATLIGGPSLEESPPAS